MEHVPQIVFENFVPLVATAHQVNIVVIVIKVVANVLDLVLENRVDILPTAGQVNIVVVVVEVLVATVLDLALDNHVERITTADQVKPVVVLIMTNSVSVLVLENRVTQMAIVLMGNVVMMIRYVKQIATYKVVQEVVLAGLFQ
jgi:hypothetical protein